MDWSWNPTGLVGLAAFLIAWPFAAFVYFTRPDRAQNRRLALLLFFEGVTWGTGAGLLFFTGDIGHARGFQALFQVSLLVLPWLHLRLLATLDSPLVGFLRWRAVDALLILAALLAPLLYFQEPTRFVVGFTATWYAPLEAVLGPWFGPWLAFMGTVTLFALAVSIHLVTRARPGPSRAKAKAFLYAFGVRDLFMVSMMLVLPLFTPFPPSGSWTDLLYVWGAPLATLAFTVIAGYGILRTQLFDIDLRLKVTLERGSLVTAFAFLVFLLTQALERLWGSVVGEGNLVLAITGAGVIAYLFRHFPQRLADRLMPDAGRPEHLRERRRVVFQEAVQSLLEDGSLGPHDLVMLENLGNRLGLDADEVQAIRSASAL